LFVHKYSIAVANCFQKNKKIGRNVTPNLFISRFKTACGDKTAYGDKTACGDSTACGC